jgi:hypothetical protein
MAFRPGVEEAASDRRREWVAKRAETVRESRREVGGRWMGDYGTGRLSGGSTFYSSPSCRSFA